MIKDINIYTSVNSWLKEDPETVIRGEVKSRGDGWIEISDENGYTQIINMNELFAVVY